MNDASREVVLDLLAVAASLPEKELRPLPGHTIALEPDKARDWGEQWRLKYGDRWQARSGGGLAPVRKRVTTVLVQRLSALGANHCKDTILALELQINGRQLSTEEGIAAWRRARTGS